MTFNLALAIFLATNACLLIWFIINFFISDHRSIIDRLFKGPIYEFPNAPTGFLIYFNGGILFIILVCLIHNLLS